MKKIISIPVNSNNFNIYNIDTASNFLNEFFEDKYKCIFVFDDDMLFLQISKK